jgi:hypothetical protein
MQTEEIGTKKYGPIGRRIYCGSTGGARGLSSEHIVPFSLGGKAELLEASCCKCAAERSYLEGYLGRNIFWKLRVHAGAPTRRRFPDNLPANIILKDERATKVMPVPDHPFFLLAPVWMPAGILRGVQPSSVFEQASAHLYYYVPENLRQTLGLAEHETAEVRPQLTGINYTTFAR